MGETKESTQVVYNGIKYDKDEIVFGKQKLGDGRYKVVLRAKGIERELCICENKARSKQCIEYLNTMVYLGEDVDLNILVAIYNMR